MLKFPCTQCEKQFKSKAYLRGHIESIHDPNHKFSCKFCKYLSKSTGELKSHIDLLHPGSLFTCDKCKKNFFKKLNI